MQIHLTFADNIQALLKINGRIQGRNMKNHRIYRPILLYIGSKLCGGIFNKEYFVKTHICIGELYTYSNTINKPTSHDQPIPIIFIGQYITWVVTEISIPRPTNSRRG